VKPRRCKPRTSGPHALDVPHPLSPWIPRFQTPANANRTPGLRGLGRTSGHRRVRRELIGDWVWLERSAQRDAQPHSGGKNPNAGLGRERWDRTPRCSHPTQHTAFHLALCPIVSNLPFQWPCHGVACSPRPAPYFARLRGCLANVTPQRLRNYGNRRLQPQFPEPMARPLPSARNPTALRSFLTIPRGLRARNSPGREAKGKPIAGCIWLDPRQSSRGPV
jgi:hypothetical protein